MTRRPSVFFLLTFFAPFVFAPVSLSDVLKYQIFLYDGVQTKQLTKSYDNLYTPILGDGGHIVWVRDVYTSYELLLYDGTNITTITNNAGNYYVKARLNNSGEVVWVSFGSVFLYDGTGTTELPYPSCYSNSGQRPCDINNNGHVVWMGRMSEDSECEIFLYDRTQVIQLSDTDYYAENPAINDSGQVVWDDDKEIFFYDGTSVTQLTDDTYSNSYPQLNENGEIVWGQYDGSDTDLFFYDGTAITQITDNSLYDGYCQINDNGDIVWEQKDDDGDYEILLYDGTNTIQLTDNDFSDGRPQINNSGQVVWVGRTPTGTDPEIHLFDGQEVIQLTANLYGDRSVNINNQGQVVWAGERLLPNPPWSAASTLNSEDPVSSTSLNCLLLLAIPIGVVILLKWGERKR